MANRDAGERFEEYVRVAIARSKHVHSPAELIRAAGMHPNTLYDLFNGTTETPGPKTIASIARVLEVPMADLWATWEGRELEPDSIEEALRRHALAVDRQNELLGELVSYIRSSAIAIIEAGGDTEQMRAAHAAIAAAQEDPPTEPADDPPSEPVSIVRPDRSNGGTQHRSPRPRADR